MTPLSRKFVHVTHQQLAAGGSTPPPLKVSSRQFTGVLFNHFGYNSHLLKAPFSDESSWELTQREDLKRSAVFSSINHLFQGRIQKFFIEGGGGGGGVGDGPNFGSERTPSPLPTAAVARYFKIFWPLTVCRCTRKGYTLLCERRSLLAREILLCEQWRTDRRRVPKNNHIF